MLSLNLPQIFLFRPTPSRERGGRIIKEAFPAQKGGLSNRRDHAKIVPPAQRRGEPESVDF